MRLAPLSRIGSVVAAIAVALAAPVAVRAGAYVPQPLHDAAVASPSANFSVIVQGRPAASAAGVAASVQAEEGKTPGDEQGIHRRFRSISAVAAQLTGSQVLWLERRDDIVAITLDAPLGSSLALPPVSAAPPTVGGAAEPGATLTADPGVWTADGPLSYAYQWLRCSAGGACSAVAGAAAEEAAARRGATSTRSAR